jgi:DNA polymerase-4
VADDLQRKGYVAKTIGIKLRYEDFTIATRDVSLSTHTDQASQIRDAAGSCLKRVGLEQRLRLLGVRASGLLRKQALNAVQRGVTASLFDDA